MKNYLIAILSVICSIFCADTAFAGIKTIHHSLKAVLHPAENRIEVEDTITLPEPSAGEIFFDLHAGLSPVLTGAGLGLIPAGAKAGAAPLESFKTKLLSGTKTFTLKYGGKINHPLTSYGKEQARGDMRTPGIISDDGVYLSGNSAWYPQFEGALSFALISFDLSVGLPEGWGAVSQGKRKHKDGALAQWESQEPQDEILLIANRFTEYIKQQGRVAAMAFLITPDKAIADKYLDATINYIRMYESLIGTYPYAKFALVENFWETGYGMPSFTLLGPKIIRFPFIINSSYPHEILHNWWGNSVFPEFSKGNWTEGITAYLSDHLIKEQQGGGAEYRHTVLQKYADYVLAGRDFPISEFRSRHSSPSEAVGYGKSSMLFHMLRMDMGDKAFAAGLQDFYKTNKFRFASFDDIRKSFEKASAKDLGGFFRQWLTRTGAPELKIENATVLNDGDGFLLKLGISQIQAGDAYSLSVPVAVTLEGRPEAFQAKFEMNDKYAEFTIRLPARPLRLDVDPEFDVFRRMNRDEIPAAFSQALGAKKMLALLPSKAEKILLQAYRRFVETLANSGPDEVDLKLDNEIQSLPVEGSVAVFGWENIFAEKILPSLPEAGSAIEGGNVRFGKTVISLKNHSIAFALKNPENKDTAVMFIASEGAEALPALARKLPHYHKYSYLAFEGKEAVNKAKGRWTINESPMTVFFKGSSGNASKIGIGRLAGRKALVAVEH
ncbi:MAG: M1 family peptidase [Nitrospirae bacterium]|nr:MAG: M1 family peptidase [Nitrospirota bacterium]